MLKKSLLLISAIIYFYGFTGCDTDSECLKNNVDTLEQEMIDWIQFKPGSYWIYKDNISGMMDSVYVTKFEIERKESFDNKRRKNRHCPIWIKDLLKIDYETKLGLRYRLKGKYGVGSGVQNNINFVNGNVGIFSLSSNGNEGSFSSYMFFPPLQGTVGAWNGFTVIKHDTIFSEYKVSGKTYQNVLLVTDGDNAALNAITNFYHVKNIGVIKKEFYRFKGYYNTDPPELLQVWELLKYHVIQ